MRNFRPLVTIVLSFSLLSACATTQAGTGKTSDALDDYTTEYAVTGAAALGAVGCVAGALLSGNAKGCLAGGAAGAAAGAVGGYALAKNQKGMEVEKQSLIKVRDTLKGDLAKAKKARELAAALVASHKAKIKALRATQSVNQLQSVALAKAVKAAKADLKRIGDVREKLDSQIEAAEASLKADKTPPKGWNSEKRKAKADLKVIKKKLIAERKKLDTDIAILQGSIDTAQPSA